MRKIELSPRGANDRPRIPVVIAQCGMRDKKVYIFSYANYDSRRDVDRVIDVKVKRRAGNLSFWKRRV